MSQNTCQAFLWVNISFPPLVSLVEAKRKFKEEQLTWAVYVKGRCWKDLIECEVEGDSELTRSWKMTSRLKWLPLHTLKYYSSLLKFSDSTFSLHVVGPGLIHVELSDALEEWTVQEIFTLPEHMMVGGKFVDDLTNEEKEDLSSQPLQRIARPAEDFYGHPPHSQGSESPHDL